MDRLQQLGSSSMAQACSTWLSSVIGDLQQQLPGLLAGCPTAAELTQLEVAVHEGIAAWHKPVMTISTPGLSLPGSLPTCSKQSSGITCCQRWPEIWRFRAPEFPCLVLMLDCCPCGHDVAHMAHATEPTSRSLTFVMGLTAYDSSALGPTSSMLKPLSHYTLCLAISRRVCF